MTEQRHFTRIPFAAATELEVDGGGREATLVNISLNGALVTFGDTSGVQLGSSCKLHIHLSMSDVVLHFNGKVVHFHENVTGIKFTGTDVASMTHLRRLLELNTADPDNVLNELMSFVGGA